MDDYEGFWVDGKANGCDNWPNPGNGSGMGFYWWETSGADFGKGFGMGDEDGWSDGCGYSQSLDNYVEG